MPTPRQMAFSRLPNDELRIRLTGRWTLAEGVPSSEDVRAECEGAAPPSRVSFDTQAVADWDSALPTFLRELLDLFEGRGIDADRSGLPEGVRRLLDLAAAVPHLDTVERQLRAVVNLLHATDGATLGCWQRPFTTLTDWILELGFDPNSISGDPCFVNPAGPDGVLGAERFDGLWFEGFNLTGVAPGEEFTGVPEVTQVGHGRRLRCEHFTLDDELLLECLDGQHE